MKTGFSLLLGEYVAATALEYRDCEPFQIVCPQCREPLFKVSRQDVDASIDYLSHYKASASYAADCELRVAARSTDELTKFNSEARDQRLKYFLEVFERLLHRDPVFSRPELIPGLYQTLNRSKAFSLLKDLIREGMQRRALSLPDRGVGELQGYASDYLKEVRDFDFIEKSGFAVATQVRIAGDMMPYLLSEPAKKNHSLLLNNATAFLLSRIKHTRPEDVSSGTVELNQAICGYLGDVIFRGKRTGMQCIRDMAETPVYPPFTESPSNLLVKVFSEIASESFGVLIRLPYFSALKERQAGSK